jgi:hypothetical protein
MRTERYRYLIYFDNFPNLFKACPIKNCKNGADFNAQTCTCNCFPNWSGDLCETLDCSTEIGICSTTFNQGFCSFIPEVNFICPGNFDLSFL